ncbi:MAG: RAD52 family DNA repair protein [Synechococcus lacustris]
MTMTTTTLSRPATPKPQGAKPQSSNPTSSTPTSSTPSHRPGFTAEQIAALAAPLDRAKVQTRSQAGRSLAYIEGWVVIAEANRIFGFDGWQRETIEVRCVAERERTLGAKGPGSSNRAGWGVTYTARVRITLNTTGGTAVIREGSGAGHGIDADLGQAHESALKEAETDAMKRALMTFGNPFGLALYDKQQRQVSPYGVSPSGVSPYGVSSYPEASEQSSAAKGGASKQLSNGSGAIRRISTPPAAPGSVTPGAVPSGSMTPGAVTPGSMTPISATAPAADSGLIPLDPASIRQLIASLRSQPRPVLEGFTKAFRKRFQVPDQAESIADYILQKQHHDWIEAFLVQHQAVT